MVIGKRVAPAILVVVSLLFVPGETKAGPITDYLHSFFGGRGDKRYNRDNDSRSHEYNRPGDRDHDRNPPYSPAQGNSVPIDGGLVILLGAGLGLGAKMIYDNKRKSVPTVI